MGVAGPSRHPWMGVRRPFEIRLALTAAHLARPLSRRHLSRLMPGLRAA
jgi:hypothetical protein